MTTYKYLDLSERYQIHCYLQQKMSAAAIAKLLNRSASTITREIDRSGGRTKYDPQKAQKRYDKSRTKNRNPYIFNGILKDRAISLLKQTDLEPAGIGPRLVLEHGSEMKVSHMTIYRYIYKDAAAGGSLYTHLRTCRKRTKKRNKEKTARQIIKERRSIHDRPKEVDNVARLGDLERDTIVGPLNKGAIQSIVDRKSSYCWLVQVHSKSPRDNHIATIRMLKPVRDRVLSLTNDNGVEFAGHKQTSRYLGAGVWFCDPYQTNQSARIEQINKLVRQYIPKKRDIRFVQPKELKAICNKINNRPRKKLGYLTPKEVFFNNSKIDNLTDSN